MLNHLVIDLHKSSKYAFEFHKVNKIEMFNLGFWEYEGRNNVPLNIEAGCGKSAINKCLVELKSRDLSLYNQNDFYIKQLVQLSDSYSIIKSLYSKDEYFINITQDDFSYDDLREVLYRLLKVSHPVLEEFFCHNNHDYFRKKEIVEEKMTNDYDDCSYPVSDEYYIERELLNRKLAS